MGITNAALLFVLACGMIFPFTATAQQTPPAQEAEVAPLAAMETDLRELLVDLGAARICQRVKGRLLGLSGKGMSDGGAPEPVVGVLMVQECSATAVAPEQLRLELAGKGWRWLSRETSKAGATFEVDHYVRFAVQVTMIATPDFAYDPQDHIATAWLLPTEAVQADVQPIGEVDVDTQGLWADLVGAAASLLGESPSARAKDRVAKNGSQSFERKLGEGFTVAVNLCTGRQATHLGTLPQGKMPPIPLDPKGQLQKGSGRALLYDGGLLMFGPFDGGDRMVARLLLQSEGAVAAQLVCEASARELYEAYLEDADLPDVDALAAEVVSGRSPVDVEASGATCPVVLSLRPAEGAPVTLEWAVFDPSRGFEPIVSCE